VFGDVDEGRKRARAKCGRSVANATGWEGVGDEGSECCSGRGGGRVNCLFGWVMGGGGGGGGENGGGEDGRRVTRVA
jgi:hypothetical protein